MRLLATTLLLAVAGTVVLRAHDTEGTRVVLTFAPDGAFVLDITHNPDWALLRLESFAHGSVPARLAAADRDARLHELAAVLIDRVVIWVDGREVRPDSAEYLAADRVFRLRGRVSTSAAQLRWLYGPVADPYPLIVRRADERVLVETIDGSNWSGTLDLSGQFESTRFAGASHWTWLVAVFGLSLFWRVRRLVR